jgi:general secretion pathway protein A
MYENFFGFKEKPFKLVPNPDYLFLSKIHEEALAHLNYALSQGDGFVEITGEVGTGKTTLCRAFLENLDEDTIAAYIFNPRLGPRQLIKTINDELGITYRTDNTKDLIDNLNKFLMRQKIHRKKVILLIDEAQNLSRNVLEQLRLLSNLETNKEKLLQIILVGQPELSEALDSYELRQLGQRITLKYHLSPLNYRETIDYIQYRISIAAQKPGLKFDRAAYRPIYRYSQGIPRLINITCDRVLLTAFGLGRHKITGNIARASIKELKSRGVMKRFPMPDWRAAAAISTAAVVILAAAIFSQPLRKAVLSGAGRSADSPRLAATVAEPQPTKTGNDGSDTAGLEPGAEGAGIGTGSAMDSVPTDRTTGQSATETMANLQEVSPSQQTISRPGVSDEDVDTVLTSSAVNDPSAAYSPQPESDAIIKLPDYLTAMDIRNSRYSALQDAMNLWQTPIEVQPYLNSLDDDQAFFRLTAKPKGVFMHRIETNLLMLKRLNLPAILELFPTGSEEPGYLTLSRIEGDSYVFGSPDENPAVVADAEQVNLYWSGVAYLPWKNFLSIWGTIPKRSNKDSIITLKLLLHDLGFSDVEINDEYDIWTRQAIQDVQAKYGIPVDGFVGPLTKMILYQEKQTFEMPSLIN